MDEEYIMISIGETPAYIRTSYLDRLPEVDAAIFDCDGVLIDIRESYQKTIIETVKYFISELTHVKLPSDRALKEAIHLLKKSGGFNNDWDSTFTLLAFFFSRLPKKNRDKLITLMRSKNIREHTLRELLDYVKTNLRSKPSTFTISFNDLIVELNRFVSRDHDSGISSIENELLNSDAKEIFLATKRFLNYPDNVKKSLLATVFDEMFYGPDLFKKIHGKTPQFYKGLGYVEIEKEKIQVTGKLLEELARAFGKENFGIVSGRDTLSARFSLGKILDKFRREATLFLMDITYQNRIDEEEKVKFRKPNPYPLIKASQGLEPFQYLLYVGDCAEDIIMAKRANEIDQRFISVGVYSLSDFQDETITNFFNINTDVIIHSINELPDLLKEIKN